MDKILAVIITAAENSGMVAGVLVVLWVGWKARGLNDRLKSNESSIKELDEKSKESAKVLRAESKESTKVIREELKADSIRHENATKVLRAESKESTKVIREELKADSIRHENATKAIREELKADSIRHENAIKALREEMHRGFLYLGGQINTLMKYFSSDASTKSKSPTVISEIGEAMSAAMDAPGIVEKHAKTLRELVYKANPQTMYDLQEECFMIVDMHLPDMLTDEELKIAKNKAYKHSVSLSNVLRVVAVLLRDKLFAEKGWALDDDDADEPASSK